jgi:ABC-type bacteriocin/lantibiotic exporter with double-glycine peptidase domain
MISLSNRLRKRSKRQAKRAAKMTRRTIKTKKMIKRIKMIKTPNQQLQLFRKRPKNKLKISYMLSLRKKSTKSYPIIEMNGMNTMALTLSSTKNPTASSTRYELFYSAILSLCHF